MRIVQYYRPRSLTPRSFFDSPLGSFENEIHRAMDAALSGFLDDTSFTGATHPRVDLFEDKDHFHFRAELPGMKKEDIHVELGEGVLTLSGSRKTYAADGKQEQQSEFSRSVSVPTRVQEDKIAARYEDGVLTVTLPKAEEVKPKRVAVQVK